LDENLVEAYVGLGICNWYLAHFGGVPPAPFWIASRNALEKAITLDSNNAQAYSELAVIFHNWEWDSTAARKALEKALLLEPNNYEVLNDHLHFNLSLKKFHIAESLLDKLVSLEPNNNRLPYYLIIYLRQGKYQKASQTLNKINLTDLSGWLDLLCVGHYYLSIGELENATIYFEEAIIGADIESLPYLGYAYAKLGKVEKANSILDQLMENAKIRYISPFYFAIVYMGLENFEASINYLTKAHEEKDFRLHTIGSFVEESIFEPLKSNQEYQKIMSNLWN
jgi:Tfp pilus assembly protein PilF